MQLWVATWMQTSVTDEDPQESLSLQEGFCADTLHAKWLNDPEVSNT